MNTSFTTVLAKIWVVITTLRRSMALGRMEQQKRLLEELNKEEHLSWYNLVSQRDGGTMRWSVVATCATYVFPLQTHTQLMKKDSTLSSVVLLHHLGLRSRAKPSSKKTHIVFIKLEGKCSRASSWDACRIPHTAVCF